VNTVIPEAEIPVAEVIPAPLPTTPPPKSNGFWKKIIPGLLLLAIVGTAGVVVGRGLQKEPDDDKKKEDEQKQTSNHLTVKFSPEKQSSAGIQTTKFKSIPTKQIMWRGGRVALDEDRIAHISPPAEGLVSASNVKHGQMVKAGETLAVIDCREFGYLKLELVKAKASLNSEKESSERIILTRTNTSELLKLLAEEKPISVIEKVMTDKPIGEFRSQLLSAYTLRNQLKAQLASQKSSPGAIPETTIRKTESELEAAEAAYVGAIEEIRFQAQYQTKQAQLKLREAQTLVDVTKAKLLTFGLTPSEVDTIDPLAEGVKASLLNVKAPFAGTIIEKHAVLSERVGPTFQMFILADLENVWLQTDLFEADIPMLNNLKNPTIRYRTKFDESEGTATLLSTGDVIDKTSKALTLTAEVKNSERKLKPGMYIEIGFETGEEKSVIQVPLGSIYRFENQPFVFVKTDDETFTRCDVTLGKEFGGMVEITEGLKGEEEIVIKGGFILKSELLKDQMVGE